ncbi:MAG: flagellar protein FliT [Betaproteobacteria bacterium]
MNTDQTMRHYESISVLSAAMLAAARNGDWDDLVAVQQHCADSVDALRTLPEPVLDSSQRQRKLEIIRKILAEDAQVRNLTQPRLAELDRLLRGMKTQHKLGQAYR